MNPRVIRTDEEHHAYLEEIARLMQKASPLSAADIDRLELLTVLVESYESKNYPVEPLDPIDAILFRMEEKGLKQADLVPYFGTSSRVSEVLKRKRPLTVQMIRALSVGLGISAETLVGLTDAPTQKREIDWSKFPIKEMIARGWLTNLTRQNAASTEEAVRSYIAESGLQYGLASFRRTLSGEAQSPTTMYALYAWLARVIQTGRKKKQDLGPFDRAQLSPSFLRLLAQMSWSERGPLLAIEYLQKNGIAVVIEPHLRGTLLDGAALRDVDGTPIIALTLRFDRLDNFWFTLIHEVVHVWKHIENDQDTFVDDLNVPSEDRREAEANRLAREAFIPRLVWKRSDAYMSPSKTSIEELARDLRIHPAIIVGRLHRELGNYATFNDLLGSHKVRELLSQSHLTILKANQGEAKALANLDARTAAKVLPLLEVGRLTDDIRQRKYIRASRTPTMVHVDRVLQRFGPVLRDRAALVDGYHWPANARAENGQHIIAYMFQRLEQVGVQAIPVVGYDRWENIEYQLGIKSITPRRDGQYCIRLDDDALNDTAEPEHFQGNILSIVEGVGLDPESSLVLLDFGDISTGQQSINGLVSVATSAIRQLQKFGFNRFASAGCSLPNSINLAADRDSIATVLRKEMILWQTLRLEFPNTEIISGDYGVRGPTTTEIHTKYINGKIRHTIKQQTFVVRGHAFVVDGGNHQQMRHLAALLVKTPHYLGEQFSWGDGQIAQCNRGLIVGSPGDWIAIDTNHHLTFVVQEVEEFERDVVRAPVNALV
jgi:HTH-type transcriptional regulator/antitoxin HigA